MPEKGVRERQNQLLQASKKPTADKMRAAVAEELLALLTALEPSVDKLERLAANPKRTSLKIVVRFLSASFIHAERPICGK